jgi:hypothetical protein
MKKSVEQEYNSLEIQRMGLASCRDGLRRDEENNEEDGEEDGEEDDEEDGEDDRKKL